MPHAYLGLGANLGDREACLRAARAAVAAWPQTRLLASSSLYETEPVDTPTPQPLYLNAVLHLETSLAPAALLGRAHALERAFGRERREANGPRTLDLDLLLYDSLQLHTPELELPHPRLTKRRFVLAPLCELAAELPLPGFTATPRELLAALPERPGVTLYRKDW